LELQKLRDEVRKQFIDRGEVKHPLKNYDLLEVHGNYEKNKQFFGSIGGQLQQIYYVLEAIKQDQRSQVELNDYHKRKREDPTNDAFKKPSKPSEITLEHYLLPFFMHYLKDMRNDNINIMMSQ